MEPLIFIIFLQIVGESFPISSSGHSALLEKFLAHTFLKTGVKTKLFDYFLHGPTILVLMILFYKDWFFPLKKLLCGKYTIWQKKLAVIFLKVFGYVCTTTFIGSWFWFLVKGLFEKQRWFSSDWTLLAGFLITAIFLGLLFLSETICSFGHLTRSGLQSAGLRKDQNYSPLTFKKVLILGFVQGVALLPGISRFGAVYVTSRLLHISPRRAFQFTFLMQFPLIVPGFVLGFFDMAKTPGWQNFFSWQVTFTFLISTILALLALWWMRTLAYKKKLGMFFFYMLVPISFLLYFMFSVGFSMW